MKKNHRDGQGAALRHQTYMHNVGRIQVSSEVELVDVFPRFGNGSKNSMSRAEQADVGGTFITNPDMKQTTGLGQGVMASFQQSPCKSLGQVLGTS